MAKFTGSEVCPKCLKQMDQTNQNLTRSWCGPSNRKANCNLAPDDNTTQHMHIGCNLCSYIWFLDPADAP